MGTSCFSVVLVHERQFMLGFLDAIAAAFLVPLAIAGAITVPVAVT